MHPKQVMVLVSKIRSSSDESTGTNSFLNKIRSTFARSNSSASLKVQTHKADSYSKVESFNESVSSPLSDSPDRRGGKVEDHKDELPVENQVVVLGDLEPERGMPDRKINAEEASSLVSICGSRKEAEAPCQSCHISELDAQPVSPSRDLAATTESTTEDELPGPISKDKPLASSAVDAKSNHVTLGEVKGRLWESTNPPAQAHPAWQIKRDKEAPSQQGSKMRFPARLPPLSSLHYKGLRKLTGSTPVLQVLNLPEPEPLSEK